MIISIRGTSGSGKSTVVRRFMDLFEFKSPHYIDGRKQPIGYRLRNIDGPACSVVGHYESPCGGCDTIHTFDEVFAHVRREHAMGYNVLFEGVLLYCEVPHTTMLALEVPDFHCVYMTTPLDECVASVNLRRWDRGDPEAVNPKNTETKMRGCATTAARLKANGVNIHFLDRQGTYDFAINTFRLNPAFKTLWT